MSTMQSDQPKVAAPIWDHQSNTWVCPRGYDVYADEHDARAGVEYAYCVAEPPKAHVRDSDTFGDLVSAIIILLLLVAIGFALWCEYEKWMME